MLIVCWYVDVQYVQHVTFLKGVAVSFHLLILLSVKVCVHGVAKYIWI